MLSYFKEDGEHLYLAQSEDGFQEHYYSAYRSTDLKSWKNIGDQVKLPKGIRHGAVFSM
ncbi:hypothetical protein [Paenibacillus oryzae]|uniref:hypothetical protein n=1 Tax=Paenibacillus oryzae TaxID=1844972 RepID=UPI0012E9DA03|nr:hypothetical protein [Paenibacillus oryzae]